MDYWLIIIAMGLLTYGSRVSFIALLKWLEMPAAIRRALRFVLPAVLSALILPELSRPGSTLDLSFGNDRLLAGILAAFVA